MLWSAISREMRVLGRDSSSRGTCWEGRGDPRERLWLFMSPSKSLCSSDSVPVTRYPKATQCCCEPQPYLPGLGLLGPHKVDMGMHTRPLPSPEDKKPGVGCNLEPTTDTKSSSTLQKLEAVGATTFSVRVLQLSPTSGGLQLSACALPSCQWPGPVGEHAWAAELSFLQEPPYLAVWITNEGPQSSVLNF